jgi:hypothetical protein
MHKKIPNYKKANPSHPQSKDFAKGTGDQCGNKTTVYIDTGVLHGAQ